MYGLGLFPLFHSREGLHFWARGQKEGKQCGDRSATGDFDVHHPLGQKTPWMIYTKTFQDPRIQREPHSSYRQAGLFT